MINNKNDNNNTSSIYQYDKTLDNAIYVCGLSAILIVTIYFICHGFFNFDIKNYTFPCMIHLLTGYYCPGCGGTRATVLFFTGHILKSLYYNPFVPYIIITGGWFMISQTIYRLTKTNRLHFHPMTIRPAHIYIGVAILLGQCLIKNLIVLFFDYHII